jgi:hypothetical protein
MAASLHRPEETDRARRFPRDRLSHGRHPSARRLAAVGATIIGLPLAAAMLTTGWSFQLVGNTFESTKPTSFDDKRALLVGLMWWLKKAGLDVVETA